MKQIKGFTVYDTIPEDWYIVNGCTTAPNGYSLISNKVSRFNKNGGRKSGIIKDDDLNSL